MGMKHASTTLNLRQKHGQRIGVIHCLTRIEKFNATSSEGKVIATALWEAEQERSVHFYFAAEA